jgi:lipoate---protein ligase
MSEFRFIPFSENSAARNMAIDEAILQCHKQVGKPTVRFYGWNPPAVSIGYFQGIEQEIDLNACKKYGIDVVRRLTGAGAVFHDKELTYSFVGPQNLVPLNILESYKKICGALINGFSKLGISSEFVPINDIISNGKKISGNAQTRREEGVLQHGTVLMEVDVDKMFSLLLVPDEKLKGKMIQQVKERVTSIELQLQKKVSVEEVSDALKKGFEERFSVKLVEGKLTETELELANKLEKEKFTNREWNYKR